MCVCVLCMWGVVGCVVCVLAAFLFGGPSGRNILVKYSIGIWF